MKLMITKDYQEMSLLAAEAVESVVRRKKNALLGLTTGNTPIGMYHALAEKSRAGELNMRETHIFSMEEYLGIPPDNYQSLYQWLNRVLIEPCGIASERVNRIDGSAPEPQLACQVFDRTIESMGGLDLVVEGIGTNGHIGFNEPMSPPDSPTRIVALSSETQTYNFAYWDELVPAHGITVGLAAIMKAKEIVLIASGSKKAYALKQALEGPVTSEIPASYLQLAPQLTIIADREAASLLTIDKEGGFPCPHSSV
ncbi:glucosamine-6-phosphate deaminase [Cohnella sp. REN36]|uniref:glucosamine-6-phosphate deaminase n=1 Tax=Cohnella sp. REN36 TaxID=2887347 RepID=UPI001D13C183|nr:glucosamine-6-phosphate deaminase [Cohnella sp. REN36]MCC3374193.1 glucosamine-6-phosphate deaminase [Cohnella sp. REN36]